VVWRDQALTVLPSGEVRLPTGAQRPPCCPCRRSIAWPICAGWS
jgi:hypothetical protein